MAIPKGAVPDHGVSDRRRQPVDERGVDDRARGRTFENGKTSARGATTTYNEAMTPATTTADSPLTIRGLVPLDRQWTHLRPVFLDRGERPRGLHSPRRQRRLVGLGNVLPASGQADP